MSLERCPGCRARLTSEPICPRCGCDLTLVRQAQAHAQQLVARALYAWALGNGEQAKALARNARDIEHSPLTWAVLQTIDRPLEWAAPDPDAQLGVVVSSQSAPLPSS